MDRELFEAARKVRERAYAPYSKFHVGAALRTEAGTIHAGCNVENAAYPEGWCAEPSAIAHMIAASSLEADRRIGSITCVADPIGGRPTTPCGGCRQRIAEVRAPAWCVFDGCKIMSGEAERAAALIRSNRDLAYQVGIILGSGLGGVAASVADAAHLPYEQLPGFPISSVSSHRNEVVAGMLEGVPVIVLAGRAHYYETGNPAVMRNPIATLRALGCDTLLLTNAAGSLRPEVGPGQIMLITDHIAYSGMNPLIGEPTDARFVGLSEAYDAELRTALLGAAEQEGVALATGVYMWFSGPSFETPAEIRMARHFGADAVGMSTVPEAILGRFFGLRVAAISTITNFAAGMTGAEITHEETKMLAPVGAAKLERVIRRYLRRHAGQVA